MHALSRIAFTGLALALLSAPAEAKEAAAAQSVVLAPVSSLGDAKSKTLQAIEKTIEAGLAAVPNHSVITARTASASANKAKRPELRTCEGEPACLASLGTLVSANYTVYAEVGGLGDAQVVYLKLIDVATSKELRSTLIELSSSADSQTQSVAAATRLLAPESYLGTLQVTTPVAGAVIYIDGQKRGTTPAPSMSGVVGSHALRVTHPEHRDYVRFIDIAFGEETAIDADLKPLPGVSQRLALEGVTGGTNAGPQGPLRATPWYLRWYTVAGGVAVVGISSAILFGAFGGDIDFDHEKKIGDPGARNAFAR